MKGTVHFAIIVAFIYIYKYYNQSKENAPRTGGHPPNIKLLYLRLIDEIESSARVNVNLLVKYSGGRGVAFGVDVGWPMCLESATSS